MAGRSAYQLLLLRHGESIWNDKGLFTGWVDVGLSERGTREAVHAGELLAAGISSRRGPYLAAGAGDPHHRARTRGGRGASGSRSGDPGG